MKKNENDNMKNVFKTKDENMKNEAFNITA